jgi:hypothetical protein
LTGHAPKESATITEEDFYTIAKATPEMMRAFYNAVNAVIECRTGSITDPLIGEYMRLRGWRGFQ